MNVLPSPARNALFAVFAAFMVATRYHHFGDVLHLPDASMALFFLGGLFLSARTRADHLRFAAFMALAVGIDVVSVGFAGASDFCVTPSYVALLPAYAVLWYGGRMIAPHHALETKPVLLTVAAALASASLSFAISNGAFYWFGGRYENPHFAEYLARAWQWGPLFVRTTMIYIVVALALHAVAARTLGARGTQSASR
ncbi:MAG: hypothetical protein JNM58_13145 [Xanthomonadaceae bacterium]|nr:hypothetical protein [Xanthomonadaceae bacterium]